MRKEEMLQNLSWVSSREETDTMVHAYVVKPARTNTLIAEIYFQGQPVVRICLTKNSYRNYFPATGKWTSKKLSTYSMEYFSWKRDSGCTASLHEMWQAGIGESAATVLEKFTGEKVTSPVHAISVFEDYISEQRNDRRYEKRKKKLHSRMELVRNPSKKFLEWAQNRGVQHSITILPYRGKQTTTGICSVCGAKNIFGPKLKSQQKIICPSCKKRAVIRKADYINREVKPMEEYTQVILFQRIKDFFVERHFMVEHLVCLDHEETYVMEIGRIFLNPNGKREYYYHKYSPYMRTDFWDDVNFNLYECCAPIVLGTSMVYMDHIKKETFVDTKFRYCALELIKNKTVFSPLDYLERYEKMPVLEMVVKTGLTKLALELYQTDIDPDAGTPWEMLRMSRECFYRLRNLNGGKRELEWLQFADTQKKSLSDKLIVTLAKNKIRPWQIMFIKERMGIQSVWNYVQKQKDLSKYKTPYDVLSDWNDYLLMARRQKMDVTRSLVYKPRNLKKAHDSLVQLCGGVSVAKRAAEIIHDYPDVEEIIKQVNDSGIYQYQDDKYMIRLPERVEDIIKEGKILGHCIDRSDIYFARIQARESYIFFLRCMSDPDQPYYTLEVEPDGAIRQKRTVGNTQGKDFDQALSFILKWQNQLQDKLTDEIRLLSETSRKLRDVEFEELRKNKVRVRGGHLMGHLLADVLEDDLLEVEKNVA